MNAVTALRDLGYSVTADGDAVRLEFTGAGQPDAADVRPLLAELRAGKAEALAYLHAEALPVMYRTEAEEEAWWAAVFAQRGMIDPTLIPEEATARYHYARLAPTSQRTNTMSNDPEDKPKQKTEEAPRYDDGTAYAPEPPALVWGAQPWDGAVWAGEPEDEPAGEQSETNEGDKR